LAKSESTNTNTNTKEKKQTREIKLMNSDMFPVVVRLVYFLNLTQEKDIHMCVGLLFVWVCFQALATILEKKNQRFKMRQSQESSISFFVFAEKISDKL
jgi:hypothetical protein